jgi:hypothetical protein
MAPFVESMVVNPDGAGGMALRQVWGLRDQAVEEPDGPG